MSKELDWHTCQQLVEDGQEEQGGEGDQDRVDEYRPFSLSFAGNLRHFNCS